MGLIKKLNRITTSRIETFLATCEDPVRVFPKLQAELDQALQSALRAREKSLRALTATQRKFDEATGRELRLSQGATDALKAGQVPLAKQVLHAQIQTETQIESLQKQLLAETKAYDVATTAVKNIRHQCENFRHKKNELFCRVAQLRTKKTLSQTQKKVADILRTKDSLINAISRLELEADDNNSIAEFSNAQLGIAGIDKLPSQLREIEKNSEVDRRLAELKNKVRQE